MNITQKIQAKRNSLNYRIKMHIQNKIMQIWNNYLKQILAVLLIQIIIISALIIKFELSQTKTVLIVNSQDMAELVQAGSDLDIEITEANVSVQSQDATRDTDSVESLLAHYFPENYEMMLNIAMWESSMNPNAININRNGSIDCGIMQINSIHGYDCEWLKNPKNNIEVARKIYDKQGLQAWASYNYRVANNLI
jgi:hypothetical protein